MELITLVLNILAVEAVGAVGELLNRLKVVTATPSQIMDLVIPLLTQKLELVISPPQTEIWRTIHAGNLSHLTDKTRS